MLGNKARELWAFLRAIEENPRDVKTRKVFSDWLDDHDEPEEAAKHRNFSLKKHDAEQYVRKFCDKYEAHYDSLLRGIADGRGYCFGNTSGPEAAEWDDEFQEGVRILLAKDIDVKSQSFRCAC